MSTGISRLAQTCEVRGTIRRADGSPVTGLQVAAFDRDLRSEHVLGRSTTDRDGSYRIPYDLSAQDGADSGSADIVVRAYGARDALLATSPVLFNAPASAVIDLTIPTAVLPPLSQFEAVAKTINPLLDGATIEELEEDATHQDISFLAGETGLDKTLLARFALAHRLAEKELPAEFWFVLLGGKFYDWAAGKTVAEQLANVSRALASLDAAAVHKVDSRSVKSPPHSASMSWAGSTHSPRSSRSGLPLHRTSRPSSTPRWSRPESVAQESGRRLRACSSSTTG